MCIRDRDKLSKIKTYKEIADMANYAILVHSLKSDARYFGFEKLADLAYQHEMESKSNNMYYVTDHFDELMTEANRIVHLVKQYLGREDANTVSKAEATPVVKEQKILVVDDSNIVSNFIKKIFNNTFDVVIANDGKEALDIVNSNTDGKIVGMLSLIHIFVHENYRIIDFYF